MTLASGFSSDLLTGLAALLAAGGIEATWDASGAYTALQTAIVLGSVPQTPDRCITLTAYGVEDDPALSDSVVGVQVRCRAEGQDKRRVDNLDDAIFKLLHGLTGVTLSTGVRVVECLRNSAASLGQDENARWMTSSNYYLHVHRPSSNRT